MGCFSPVADLLPLDRELKEHIPYTDADINDVADLLPLDRELKVLRSIHEDGLEMELQTYSR